MERTKTAKAGCEFAAQMVLEFGRDKILPVNIDSLVQQTISIPEEDYRNLQLLGIDPDPQEYWEGYNSFFAEEEEQKWETSPRCDCCGEMQGYCRQGNDPMV